MHKDELLKEVETIVARLKSAHPSYYHELCKRTDDEAATASLQLDATSQRRWLDAIDRLTTELSRTHSLEEATQASALCMELMRAVHAMRRDRHDALAHLLSSDPGAGREVDDAFFDSDIVNDRP